MVKSARQVSFTIVVLTAIAIQLGWFERERIERHAVYAYIEKVLALTETFQTRLATATISQVSLTAKTPPILLLTAGTDNPAAIFVRSMGDLRFSEVSFGTDFDQLKTLGDPGGDCSLRIFRGSGTNIHGIEVINALSSEQRFSEVKSPRNSVTYLVLFGRACLLQTGDIAPVLVVYDPADPDFKVPSVVISKNVASAAGMPLDTDSDFGNERFFYASLYSKDTLAALSEVTELTRPAYTEAVLRAAVAREAMRIGGSPFELKDWRDAIAKIYERSARAPSILGFNLPSEIAAFFLPLILTAVVFAFMFRVRRITALDDDEVWVLTHSRGIHEHIGAVFWYAALLAAPIATMWGLSAYAPEQVETMFISLQVSTFQLDPTGTETRWSHAGSALSAPAFWALAATALSSMMMLWAVWLLLAIRRRPNPAKPKSPRRSSINALRRSFRRNRKRR